MKLFKNRMKKGFTIVELIFVIVLMAVLSMGVFVMLNKQSTKTMTDDQISTGVKALMVGVSEYKIKAFDAKYNYNGISGATLAPFLDMTNTFAVGSSATELMLVKNNNIKIKVNPDTINSVPNAGVKIYFDVSGLKDNQGYTKDELKLVENTIARTFRDAYPSAIIGGASTSEADATPGANVAPTDDGQILVGKIN